MSLVPGVWAQMAAEWRNLQNLLGLVHIALGLLTVVAAPFAVAGVSLVLLDAGAAGSALPLGALLVRGGAVVFAGVSLVVAGHAASRAFQLRLMDARLRRFDVILLLGWGLWAGGIWIAVGNSFASPA
jgi:hypothetical protein